MPNRSTRVDSPHRAAAIALAGRVKGARAERGVSQQEVARQAGVSIGAVRALEGGRTVDPSFFTVVAVARVLGLSVGDLAEQPASAE